MPSYLNAVRDELVELVAATWPEVVDNGIYRSRELATIPFDQKGGGLPVAVIDLDATPTDEWGNGNSVDEIVARIYRIPHDIEDADALVESLESLRIALWPTGFSGTLTTARILQFPALSDALDNPLNRYFIATGRPFYSGMVIVRMIAGVMPG